MICKGVLDLYRRFLADFLPSVAFPKILLDTNHILIVSSSRTSIPSGKRKATPRI